MNSFERYGPIIAGSLSVLIVGALNPQIFQQKKGGRYTGFPSYFWLALISLAVALLFQALNPLEMMCGKL